MHRNKIPVIRKITTKELDFNAHHLVGFNCNNQIVLGRMEDKCLVIFTQVENTYNLTASGTLDVRFIGSMKHLLPSGQIVIRFKEETLLFRIDSLLDCDIFPGAYGELLCVLPNGQGVYASPGQLDIYQLAREPNRAHWKVETLHPPVGDIWSGDLSICRIEEKRRIVVCDCGKRTLDMYDVEGE